MRPGVCTLGVVFALSLACGGKDDEETTDTQAPEVPTSTTETVLPPHPDGPVLTDCTAVCSFHATGDQFWTWALECLVTDPQGPETIQPFGELNVLQGATVVVEAAISCGNGRCSTSFKEDGFVEELDISLDCETPSQWTFEFIAKDLEGHEGRGTAVGSGG